MVVHHWSYYSPVQAVSLVGKALTIHDIAAAVATLVAAADAATPAANSRKHCRPNFHNNCIMADEVQ